MGTRERYEPGTFCWVDLATTDVGSAAAFYGGLFGWRIEGTPGGGAYAMFLLDGDRVGAVYELEPERRALGVPPHWLSYVSVRSADAAAARAEELGGQSFGGAFDAAPLGRMAVVQDPAGAVFAAWEARELVGARRVNDPGCFSWNDLRTGDVETASAFYSGLFGWEMNGIQQDGRTVYVTIANAGGSNGGIMSLTEDEAGTPPFWLVYFVVPSCEGAAARARELGGRVLAGPMQPGAGTIAVLADPQGAAFAVFEGETDD